MSAQNFSAAGAVDLSALAARNQQPDGGQGAPSGGYVIDLTDENFQQEVQRSASVPMVIDFWADWCQPCKQLGPILERLANEYAGRFILARVDIEANQQLAQAAQVQSIPMVVGVLAGQLVPLFMGALPEDQVRQYLDELLKVAASNGVTGTAEPPADAQEQGGEEEPAVPPKYAAADEALGRGDIDGAIAAYGQALAETPGDEIATAGLARAELLKRTSGLDVAQVRDEAAARPDDVQVQCRVADLEVSGGHVDDAFNRLIQAVKRLSGDDRDAAREHLIELFSAVGLKDPRVAKARRDLASALF